VTRQLEKGQRVEMENISERRIVHREGGLGAVDEADIWGVVLSPPRNPGFDDLPAAGLKTEIQPTGSPDTPSGFKPLKLQPLK